ncbi:PhzF family phenazine biosynthesis protein [Neobacillus sp. D3-1R]|uniref:PhzF family phenazine biosynthesis protein n=1 Tax=Neobacillus sp. D3-1R TaxID=3445778 RepID=UPI003F9F37F4
MKEVQVFHVDAFTDQPFGGNAAGVVPNADQLTEYEMQKIARELNLSETAFIIQTNNAQADVRVRYFTPTDEIDFCGHATIALSWILATEYGWLERSAEIRLETNIGIVPVKWSVVEGRLQSVVMTQVSPKVKEIDLDRNEICRLIGVTIDELDERFPIKLGYTGNWHLLVPIKTRKSVDAATPLIEELGRMNKELRLSTTHLFTFDGVDDAMLYTRDFAPAVGITEDPVTGSANGALAGYLVLEGIIDPKNTPYFKIAQGHSVGRPGSLDIEITYNDHELVICVGGTAVKMIAGTMVL